MKFVIHAVFLVAAFLLGIYVGVKFPNHANEINNTRANEQAKIVSKTKIEVYTLEENNVKGDDPASVAKRAEYQADIDAENAKLVAANAGVPALTQPQP